MKIIKYIKLLFFIQLIFSCSKTDSNDYSIIEDGSYLFSTPEKQGMNSELLDKVYQKANSLGFVDGIIISKNGYIVGEKYLIFAYDNGFYTEKDDGILETTICDGNGKISDRKKWLEYLNKMK